MAKEKRPGKKLPFKEVVLLDGTRVVVWQWPYRKGLVLSARLFRIQQEIASEFGADATVELVAAHKAETIRSIVQETIEWSDEEWEQHVEGIEDFLGLLAAVWETSIVRPGGGGVFPLILGMVGAVRRAKVEELVQGMESQPPSGRSSTVSSEPATASQTSTTE